MIAPNGQVVQAGAGRRRAATSTRSRPLANLPFYHFWLTEREGVVPPLWASTSRQQSRTTRHDIPKPNPNYGVRTSQNYLLPMPKGTPNYSTDDRRRYATRS